MRNVLGTYTFWPLGLMEVDTQNRHYTVVHLKLECMAYIDTVGFGCASFGLGVPGGFLPLVAFGVSFFLFFPLRQLLSPLLTSVAE